MRVFSSKFLASFIVSSILVPLIALFVNANLPTFAVFAILIFCVIGYVLKPRYDLYKSLTEGEENMVEVEGNIISNETIESPFLGEDCVATVWDVYEWSSNFFRRNDTWVQAATGASFADNIRIKLDGQEYVIGFEDMSKSREVGKFFSKQRIGNRPLSETAGTRIHGISVEITSGTSTVEVDADEEPPDRIRMFLEKLKTGIGPTDKSSIIFNRKEGDRKYTESIVNKDDTIFVRGKEVQGDEFGVKKIVPSQDSLCVFTDKSKERYITDLKNSVEVLSGILTFSIVALIASGIVWYTGLL